MPVVAQGTRGAVWLAAQQHNLAVCALYSLRIWRLAQPVSKQLPVPLAFVLTLWELQETEVAALSRDGATLGCCEGVRCTAVLYRAQLTALVHMSATHTAGCSVHSTEHAVQCIS